MPVREVHYNGYRLRSKIEAQYSFLFDQLDIAYYYEPECYTLSDNSGKHFNYMPDFFLPEVGTDGVFLEIKLEKTPLLEECFKCSRLSIETGKRCYLMYESIGKKNTDGYVYHPDGEVERNQRLTQCPFCKTYGITTLGKPALMECDCSSQCGTLQNDRAVVLESAYKATRAERFGS